MKLIIDIPNYKLDEVQNGSIASGEILKAVRAGTPVSTEGDLISRSALLKAMEEERQYLLARGLRGAEHILVHHCLPLIDNAPTVEPERPQGEWIKVKEERMSIDMSGGIVTRYKCSKCERVIATFPSKLADYYPFCHCGADMKGGAEND